MTALTIKDIKDFMLLLFSDSTFDGYMLVEADIVMGCRYIINGRRVPSFYDSTGAEESKQGEYCSWIEQKRLIFEMIKGRRLPVSMKLVLLAPQEIAEAVRDCARDNPDRESYFINMRYDNKMLLLTTGFSSGTFSLDRGPEQCWDEYVTGMIKQRGITFEK